MYGPLSRLVPVKWVLGGLLFCAACCATSEVRAQPQTARKGGQPTDAKSGQDKAPATQKSEGRGAGAARGGGRAAGAAGRGGEPSAAYQESLRQTVERRRQRRARRQQNAGDSSAADWRDRALAHVARPDYPPNSRRSRRGRLVSLRITAVKKNPTRRPHAVSVAFQLSLSASQP